MRLRGIPRSLLVGSLLLAFTAIGSASNAQVNFTESNITGLQNILFDQAGETGFSIVGQTQNPAFDVRFTSLNNLAAYGSEVAEEITGIEANGQAKISDANFENIDYGIRVEVDNGGTFTKLRFNTALIGSNSPPGDEITVIAYYIPPAGGLDSISYVLKNGSNFLSIYTDPGFDLTKVEIFPKGAYVELQQVRIGFDRETTELAPEASSMALLAGGVVPMFGFLRLRRRRR